MINELCDFNDDGFIRKVGEQITYYSYTKKCWRTEMDKQKQEMKDWDVVFAGIKEFVT